MDTNEKLQKEYQKTIDKLFTKLSTRDKQIDDMARLIKELDKQVKTLIKLNDRIIKKIGDE